MNWDRLSATRKGSKVGQPKKAKRPADPGGGSIQRPASSRTLARLRKLCEEQAISYREPRSQWHAQRMLTLLKARRPSSVSGKAAAPR